MGATRLAAQRRTVYAQQRRILPGTCHATEPQGSRPRPATNSEQTAGRTAIDRPSSSIPSKAQLNTPHKKVNGSENEIYK